MAFFSNFATTSSMTLLSRVLGFIRDSLFAAVLGTGIVADAFFVALRLPNFFRALFAEGAFSAAFMPLYIGRLANSDNDKSQAKIFARDIATILLLATTVFCLIAIVFMPLIIGLLAPGFTASSDRFQLAVNLTRITFPFLIFISLVSLLGSILNAHRHFAAVAACPIIMNIVLIIALFWAFVQDSKAADHAYLQAIAITISGVLQFIWLILALKRYHLSISLLNISWQDLSTNPFIKRFFYLLAPASLGAGIYQINVFIGMVLSSFLPSGSISYLFYADRLNQLPLGVIGVALGTVLLPIITKRITSGDEVQANISTNRGLEWAVLLSCPAAAALMIIAQPIAIVLFEHGTFNRSDSIKTAFAILIYATGIPAMVIAKLFQIGFYARQDTKTPVRCGIIAMLIHIFAAIILMQLYGYTGLAAAASLAAWVNCGQLIICQWQRKYFTADRQLITRLPRIIIACLIMASELWYMAGYFANNFVSSGGIAIVTLGGLIISGFLLYGLAAIGLGVLSKRDLLAIL